MQRNRWRAYEDAVLVAHYPSREAISAKLPHRTWNACCLRARKLKLSKPMVYWQASEISLLRKLYRSASLEEIGAAFPTRQIATVLQTARRHKIPRARILRIVDTGNPLIDEIRNKAFQLNLTMKDLDKMAGTEGYFDGQCHYRTFSASSCFRAIEALGGKISVQWDE